MKRGERGGEGRGEERRGEERRGEGEKGDDGGMSTIPTSQHAPPYTTIHHYNHPWQHNI
jgi:hypothetical protein